jgi:hypothetical protein
MASPLFPLHVVLFPGQSLPLQVFEPRYREMLDHVLRDDRRFGVVAIRRGMEVGGFAETFDVGCIGEVTRMQRAPDGTMQLIVEGRERFRIAHRLPDDPYPIAEVDPIGEELGVGAHDVLPDARAAVRRYMSAVAQLEGMDVVVPQIPDEPIDASYVLAASLRLEPHERQAMLEAPDARARLESVVAFARRETLLLEAIGPSVGAPNSPVSLN